MPDCRAYEQVSEGDKNGVDVFVQQTSGNYYNFNSSPDGNPAQYLARAGFVDAPSNFAVSRYVAKRSAGGWITAVAPTTSGRWCGRAADPARSRPRSTARQPAATSAQRLARPIASTPSASG